MNARLLAKIFLAAALAASLAACSSNPLPAPKFEPAPEKGIGAYGGYDISLTRVQRPGVFQAGSARVDIAPRRSVIMGGYGYCMFSKNFCRWSRARTTLSMRPRWRWGGTSSIPS
ncbi:MAG: hypothetical protein M5R36_13000 [Deltaproteobacteria bacterium]|nr:hypothetical protein [Deltaproteobacteria bacterium]